MNLTQFGFLLLNKISLHLYISFTLVKKLNTVEILDLDLIKLNYVFKILFSISSNNSTTGIFTMLIRYELIFLVF